MAPDFLLSRSCRQSSGAFRKGSSREGFASLRSKFLREGQISCASSLLKSGKNLARSADMSTSTASTGTWTKESSMSLFSDMVLSLRSAVEASCASSLLSKTIRPLPSIARWLRSRPFAPPSSKSADAFLNSGSTENSSSIFFSCSWANEPTSVASDDR